MMNPTLAKAAANLKRRVPQSGHGRALPSLWLMSDGRRLADPEAVLAVLPRGAGFILRHYDAPDRAALAARLAALCRKRGIVLVIAGDWRLAARVGAAGVHLAEHAAHKGPDAGARLWRRNKARLLTVAAHGASGLRRARDLKASAVLLSPVFTTPSHPERRTLGVTRLAALTRMMSVPVIALGGISAANIGGLRNSGCAGIAGIGFILEKN